MGTLYPHTDSSPEQSNTGFLETRSVLPRLGIGVGSSGMGLPVAFQSFAGFPGAKPLPSLTDTQPSFLSVSSM